MNAGGLKKATVADADFLGDMTIPPIGGQAVAAVVFLGWFDSNVIRAFEVDNVLRKPSLVRVATAECIGGEAESKICACIAQSIEIPDLGLDGCEV